MAFTVFSMLCSLLALLGAWFAWRCASDATHAALELRKSRADIAAHTAVLEQLGQQIQKLRGQFFAFKFQQEQQQLPLDDDDDDATPVPSEDVCENWKKARTEGPNSAAAKCECDYCAAQRASRRAVRSALLPPTVAAQARMIEDVANGRE